MYKNKQHENSLLDRIEATASAVMPPAALAAMAVATVIGLAELPGKDERRIAVLQPAYSYANQPVGPFGQADQLSHASQMGQDTVVARRGGREEIHQSAYYGEAVRRSTISGGR